jgi:hypothetical protein
MKISNLISKLEKLKEKHGDIHLLLQQNGMGGHAMHTTKKEVRVDTMSLHSFIGEEDLDDDVIKEFFPEWDGDIDTKENPSIKVVVLSTEDMLYAT